MTPATAKNLTQLIDRRVVIEWVKPEHDWPHFTLLGVDSSTSTIFLRGESYPDGTGEHDGSTFWADWSDVRKMTALVSHRAAAAIAEDKP